MIQSQLELYFTRKILQCWLELILCYNIGMAITFCSETAKLLSLQARRTLWQDKRYSIRIKEKKKTIHKRWKKKKHLTAIYKLARPTLMWNQCCFITSILKSLVIVAVWLALIGAIYSRIARLTINLQESEIYFCNFTNQLNQWFTVTIISQQHWYGRGKANQQLDRDNYFLVHSGWNLKSNLLVIPPGFTAKTKNKEISKGSYNTSRDLHLRAWRLPIAQL